MTHPIDVELTAEPLRLTMPGRKNFKISMSATNQGKEVVDPELHRAQLFVNGKRSRVWSLAIGNGRREAAWSALPPGETVSMTWSSMGKSLFPNPGTFDLVLHFQDAERARLRVEVLGK
jgi:hypothetical protein